MISIKGLDKAEVLMVLYNAACRVGFGLQMPNSPYMDLDEAIRLVRASKSFDILYGRFLKIDLSGDWLDEGMYDFCNRASSARAEIQKLHGDELIDECPSTRGLSFAREQHAPDTDQNKGL